MNKILIISILAVFGLVGTVSSPQLIQRVKNNFYPTPKAEKTLIFDDIPSFDGGSNNRDDQNRSAVKGESTSIIETNHQSQPTPTKPPTGIPEGGWGDAQPTQQTQYVPIPVYQSPQTNTYNNDYWDKQIKQADQEAADAKKARETYDQQCSELTSQRNAALAPINTQINETRGQLYTVEERVNERTRGQFVSETQRLRMIEAESAELQNKLNKLQNEYDSIYAQYGSC